MSPRIAKKRCVAPIAIQLCVSKSMENARSLRGGEDGSGIADQFCSLGYDCLRCAKTSRLFSLKKEMQPPASRLGPDGRSNDQPVYRDIRLADAAAIEKAPRWGRGFFKLVGRVAQPPAPAFSIPSTLKGKIRSR
jgi:hypothetical protein